MNCSLCKQDVDEQNKICSFCGNPISNNKESIQYCPRCGTEIEAGNVFCNGCGQNLNETELVETIVAAKNYQSTQIFSQSFDNRSARNLFLGILSFLLIVSVGVFIWNKNDPFTQQKLITIGLALISGVGGFFFVKYRIKNSKFKNQSNSSLDQKSEIVDDLGKD